MSKKLRLNYDEKFKIMFEYLERNKASETGIKARTKFGEYPIGQWQSRMRTDYYHGKLQLEPDLEKKLLELGILRKEKERETSQKLTWEEKYSIMEEYLKSGKSIEYGTVYKGYKIGQWQTVIRHLLYTGRLHTVSPELKKKLFQSGILKKEKVKSLERGSKKLSYNEKFQIMLEYLESTDFEQEIHQKTTFKNHRIGVWQDNLRQTYRKGRDLEISPELMEKLFAFGILREEDKKTRKSRIQGTKTSLNTEEKEEADEIIKRLLQKQKERKALDEEITRLKTIIKNKTGKTYED